MRKNVSVLPTILSVLLGLALLMVVCLQTLLPRLILPRPDIPTVVLVCALALLAEHYLAPEAQHNPLLLALLGAAHFGALPLCAAFVPWQQGLELAAVGALALPLCAAAFRTACRSEGALRPWVMVVGLYLAAQALRGVWL